MRPDAARQLARLAALLCALALLLAPDAAFASAPMCEGASTMPAPPPAPPAEDGEITAGDCHALAAFHEAPLRTPEDGPSTAGQSAPDRLPGSMFAWPRHAPSRRLDIADLARHDARATFGRGVYHPPRG